MIFQDTKWIWEQSIFVQAYRLKKCVTVQDVQNNRSQVYALLRAVLNESNRDSVLFRHFEIKIHPIVNKFA